MTVRQTFVRTLVVVGTLVSLYLLLQLAEVVGVLIGAIIFASAIRPIVIRLQARGVPTWLGVLGVYLSSVGLIVGILTISVPPLVSVMAGLLQDQGIIFRTVAMLYGLAQRLGYDEQLTANLLLRLVEQREVIVGAAQSRVMEQGPAMLQGAVLWAGRLVLAFVMAFYWLTSHDAFETLLGSVTPVRHREKAIEIFHEVETTMGAWVRGTFVLMVAIGAAAFAGLMILRVPNALPLAFLAGLFEAVPMVGATLGALPAILIAFTVSPEVGLLTILLFVVIQFLENNILVPRVMEANVGLNPLLILVAIVAGSTLGGIVGAMFAIPIVAAVHVLFRRLLLAPLQVEAQTRHEENGIPIFDSAPEEAAPESAAPKEGRIAPAGG